MMSLNTREEDFKEAAALGNLRAVLVHLQTGVNVNHQNKMNGWSAMHWACSRDQKDVAEMLISNGADVQLKDVQGRTPSQVAKGSVCELCIQVLIQLD
jgi:ankyrin repeat protein